MEVSHKIRKMFGKRCNVKCWTISLIVCVSLCCMTLMIGHGSISDGLLSVRPSYRIIKQGLIPLLGRTFGANVVSSSSLSSSLSTTTSTVNRSVADSEKEIPWSQMKSKLFHEGKIKNTVFDKGDARTIDQCVRYKNAQLKADCQINFNTNRSSPITALASFPGSGNTWTRLLLEKATGIFTGSAYNDSVLFNSGNFCGEYLIPQTYKTLCVKTHFKKIEEYIALEKITKVILLIRNPYKAVIAYFNWRMTQSWTKQANLTDFQSTEWIKRAANFVRRWKNTYHVWLNHQHPVHLVKFEDMKSNTSATVSKILKYLGNPTMRSNCLQHNSEGSFHRITSCKTVFNPFTPTLQRLVNQSIYEIEAELKSKGFPVLGYDMSVLNC